MVVVQLSVSVSLLLLLVLPPGESGIQPEVGNLLLEHRLDEH